MNAKKIWSARSKEKTEKRVTVNFTPTEYAHFLTMKEKRRCIKSVTIHQGKGL